MQKIIGIPQNRERVFIISIRKDIDKGTFSFPKKQTLQLKLKDFDFPDSKHSSSIAHIIERFLGCLVLAEKKKISDVLTTKQYLIPIQKILLQLKFFVFRKKISNRGILTVKTCKIPVYRRKIDE